MGNVPEGSSIPQPPANTGSSGPYGLGGSCMPPATRFPHVPPTLFPPRSRSDMGLRTSGLLPCTATGQKGEAYPSLSF